MHPWRCANAYQKCSCTGTVYYGRRYDTDNPHNQKTKPLLDFESMIALGKYTTYESDGSVQCEPKVFRDPDGRFIKSCWCAQDSKDHSFWHCI